MFEPSTYQSLRDEGTGILRPYPSIFVVNSTDKLRRFYTYPGCLTLHGLRIVLLCVKTIANPAKNERERETRTGNLQGPLIILLIPVKTIGNPTKDEKDTETRTGNLQGPLIVLLLSVKALFTQRRMKEIQRPELVICKIRLLFFFCVYIKAIGNLAKDERERETRTGIM